MIVPMAKIRLLGPRERLPEVMETVADLGVLHLDEPPPAGRLLREADPDRARRTRQVRRALADVDAVLERLARDRPLRATPAGGRAEVTDLARWARRASRLRRDLDALARQRRELIEERAEIDRYERFFAAFAALVPDGAPWPRAQTYHLLVRADRLGSFEEFRVRLAEAIGSDFELLTAPLEGGDLALLLIVPEPAAVERTEALLAGAGIEELAVPERFGAGGLGEAIPRMRERRREIDAERRRLAETRRRIREREGREMARARAALADRLIALEADARVLRSERAFVAEGWLPQSGADGFTRALADRFGHEVVVERVAREEWSVEDVPVVMRNPRLFRPFEAIVAMFPLPSYGTIDPTPFVAVFFPMFFGVILGDVAYGLVLGLLAAVLHLRSRRGTTLRSVAEIAGACAAFTIAFGFVYGELLGDVGHRWLGLEPLVFDRREALVPFFGLTLALGTVHVLLGLVLGALNVLHTHPRQSIARGLSALMIVLVVVAILAAVDILPREFFNRTVVGLLIAFPILVVLEGILAPMELLSTLGNILSYARIMALGTASVVMAVVANRMVGSMGGVVVGVLFALLFHLVNFALGVFGPTIHSLRLHYVEFFGKFYSPGGVRYRPFGHWQPNGSHGS